MFAPFTVVGDSFRADKPQLKRLAVVAARDQSVVQDKVVFVFNFFDYLRKIAPVKK